MNNSVKFNVYSLKFKADGCDGLRRAASGVASRVARCLLLTAMLLTGALTAMAQNDYYVFRNTTYGYIAVSNTTTPALSSSFTPECVWVANGGALGTTNRSIYSYTDNTKFLRGGGNNTALTIGDGTGNAATRWQLRGTNYLNYNNSTYVKWNNNALTCLNTNNGNRFTAYTVGITPHDEENTISTDISISGIDGNTISFTHTALSGSYTPEYTTYRINNSVDHNWYNDTDNGTTTPTTINANTLSPTYTWSLTANGGGVASINPSTGVLTLNGAPTGNITVRLTVSNTTPSFTKTVDFTLTRGTVAATNPTLSITNNGLSGGGIQLTPSVTGTYYPSCTTLTNGTTYYWDATNSVLTTTRPGEISSWGDATKTWTVTTGGAYASVSSGGLVTITDDPAGNVVVQLALSKGGYAGNTSITFTRNHVDEVVSTTVTMSAPTLTPATKTLEYGEGQAYSTSATVTATTTTTQAYDCLANGGNYYYYDGSLHAAAPEAEVEETHPTPTFNWALSGAAAGNLSLSTTSGSTTTATYSNASAAASANATLTVTASTPGAANRTATATITVLRTLPTEISVALSSVSLCVGDNSEMSYTLLPAGAYDGVTVSSSNACVTASVDNAGMLTLTGVSAGSATVTLSCDGPNSTTITKTVTVTVMSQCATPTISYSNATGKVTISGTADHFYYTVDGSTPSDGSDEYSAAFDRGTPATIKAIAYRDGYCPSDVASYSLEQVATPTIEITTSGISFSGADAGATYYYNLSGGDPATQWNGSPITSGCSDGDVIKVVAKKNGMINSVIATKVYYTPTGVSGTIVSLNDFEDHSWSYYSDATCPIRSLSPADVKITYYGDGIVMTGNADYTAESVEETNYIKPGNGNYVGGAKVNVGGEDENTFVYYKTLERGDATQSVWTFSSSNQSSASSRCPYTTIPNPFQVRPTYGTTGNARWRGFQCWRLKSVSGGAVYSAASGGTALSAGAVINAETEIYFAPNAETGMTVSFEAVWARAYVADTRTQQNNTGSNNDYYYYTVENQNVGYERNFVVLSKSNNACIISDANTGTNDRIKNGNNNAFTVSDYYPNGTSGSYSGSIGGADITLTVNTKFENVVFSDMGSRTLTAAGNDLIIGRGCSSTINYVRGIGGNVTSPSYTLRIESGTINYLSFLRGYSTTGGTQTDNGSTLGGTPNVKGVLGCDYDRATNSGITNNLIINNGVYYGYGVSEANGITYSEKAFTAYLKSGKIGNSFNINGSSYTASAAQAFYIGVAAERVRGHRTLYMEGGEVASLAGGIDATQNQNNNSVTFRIKGGHVRGAVYGGAARSAAYGNRNLIITGGSVTGWFGGGCNGEAYPAGQTSEDTYGGITNGSTKVYFGGTATCGGTGSNVNINGSVGGIVFGAGKGVEGNTTSGRMAQGTTVVVADECNIERNVYGGGNFGYAQTSTDVYVSGGTVQGSVFGGSNQNNGPVINIKMIGGIIEGGLYGGCNTTGTISGKVTMQIDGGQVGTSSIPGNIHGGGYGQPTRVNNDVEITLGSSCTATEGVTVYGDVYGGSAFGHTNGTTASDSYHTYVTLYAGTINGSLYGGALGAAGTAANVYGPVQVKVFGGSVKKTDANGANGSGAVYGCNNINGAPQRAVSVDIYGTDPAPSAEEYALFAVYGGGNKANYSSKPLVKVHNCNNSIEYVYGGGNAAQVQATDVKIYGGNTIGNVFGGGNGTVTAANVTDSTHVDIYGGTILRVFGGSNSAGTIGGSINVTAQSQTETGDDPCTGDPYGGCAIQVHELYGGGNRAASNAGSITIGCMEAGDMVDYVYGGANEANVTGDITLTMNGGRVGNLFGGNNTSGTISGGINVTVNWGNRCSNNHLGNVFGGGNLAQYTIPNNKALAVNILNGTVSGNVYGGGKGLAADHSKGQVTGNPVVTIGDNSHTAIVEGDVYGGGDAGNVVGTPVVNVVNNCNTEVGNVYGGGNAADVSGTDVNIDGGTIGDVFGGGHGDKNVEPQKVANVGGDVDVTVTGGTITKVFGGSNSKGTITGNILLTVQKANTSCDMHITEVYGGGNEAAGNAGEINIVCTGGADEGIEYVYGGANQADVSSNITLNITGGRITRGVFGGNNTSGNISGTITVNVEWDNSCAQNYLYDVFGGGKDAAYSNAGNYPQVNIKNGTVSHNVYGGGQGSTAVVTSNPVVTIGDLAAGHEAYVAAVTGDVYGGGDAAAVTGHTYVQVQKANSTVGAVYGGGNAAGITGYTEVDIDNGTVSNVYGGGKAAGVSGTSTVTLTNGNVTTGVYGGCNTSGTVGGAVAVNINGGTVGASGAGNKAYGVFGGGYGESTSTGDAVTVTIGNGTTTPTIYGDVYGGSAKGNVNDAIGELTKVWLRSGTVNGDIYGGGFGDGGANALVNGQVQVVIDGGRVNQNNGEHGCVFGCNNANGTPKGAVSVTINSTSATIINAGVKTYALQGVYGGGNLAAYNPTTAQAPTVVVNGCGSSIKDLYGGGNAAPVPATDVTINGGDIDRAFAGGNGESGIPAHVGYNSTATSPDNGTSYGTGIATILVTDGTVNKVFGGSNANGIIRTSANVNVERGATSCGLHIGELYGGGNEADGKAGLISIGCTGDADEGIEYVYGGANQADVTGDITLNITGGRITRGVFGGNNTSGTISGDIIVNVEWDGSCDQNYLYDVFGAGNLAAYTGSPAVNIKNGTVSHNVYGGGKGGLAVVTGNPVVTIGDLTVGYEAYVATVTGDVYGGGDAAAVTGHPYVQVQKANSTVGAVYGGGNAAGITGYTEVDIDNGTVGNVYGGGNAAGVTTTTTVNVNNGSVSTGVYGGCNSSGTIGGNIEVNINGGTHTLSSGIFGGGYGASTSTSGDVTVNIGNSAGTYTPSITGDIYGGSALGSVNDALADATKVNILSGTVTGNIYGGGLGEAGNSAKGQVNGTVTVNIGTYTGTLDSPTLIGHATINGMVFGGNNTNGSPQGNVFVNVFKTAHTSGDGISSGNGYPSTLKEQADEEDELDDADYAALTDEQRTALWAAERFAIAAVYGGGNQASYTAPSGKKATVTVYGCEENTVQYVYGGCRGGSAGVVSSTETDVVINGGHIKNVFGGGDGSGAGNLGANVTGDATVTIKGGLIDAVFGGSNTLGVVQGTSTVDFDYGEVCEYLLVNSVYGGGNQAPSSGTIVVNIPCGTMGLKDVYGGANQANHTGNVELNIFGGSMERAFGGSKNANITGNVTVNVFGGSIGALYGGNNEGGAIGGKITVNVDHNNAETCTDPIALDRIYGGGRNAAYTPGSPYGPASNMPSTPEINIIHDSVTLYIFGGGYGSTARVTGNPQVNLGADRPAAWTALGWTKGNDAIGDIVHVHNDVYGGGEAAPVTGNTRVHLHSSAGTHDNPTIVDGSIFGGGLGYTATIDFRYNTLNTQKADTLTSGVHRGWPYTGNTEVDIRGERTLVIGSVYGGGNAGIVYGNTDVIIGDYDAQVVTPAITFTQSWNGSTYLHSAEIVTTTNNVNLYYTTDGSDPDDGSSAYSAPFDVTPGATVKAIGMRDGYTNSDITSVVYRPVSPTPEISYIRDGGDIRAVLTTPAGASDRIWYRLGGSDPDEGNRTVYNPASKPIVIIGDEIRAYSLGMNNAGWDLSAVAASTVAAVDNPAVTVDGEGRVTVTCATPGATIRYTSGATPADVTEGSDEWPGTLQLTMNQHIKVVAYKEGMVCSEQVEGVHNAVTATPAIVFGRQGADVVADITCATAGVTLLYRIGGTDPDPANIDEVNTKTFDVNHRPVITDGQVIKAIAVKAGRNNSAVASATAQIVAKPAIAISSTGMVTITPAAGSTVRYTTDGSEPDGGSTVYSAPFQAANFATIKAAGFRDGYTESDTASDRYVPTVATPTVTFQRNGSTIKPMIECTTPGAEIYWSTDGVDPTDGSLRYFPASANVTSGVTLKARAYCVYPYDWNPSAVLTVVVTDAVATPVITVSEDGTSITGITCATGGATIRYTTGEEPVTESSPVYSGTINNINNTTFNAAAFKDGLIASITAVKRSVATPVIAIDNNGNVSITSATGGATINYTTDGNDPEYAYGTTYSATFGPVSDGTTIKAVAYKAGEIISAVSSVTRADVAAPSIEVNNSTRYISIVPPSRSGLVLRYTTDGTDPGIAALAYTYQFRMPGATIKAITVLDGNLSAVTTIEPVATPAASRVGTTVTITCLTEGATIYYTTDGSSPNTSSHRYTGPFSATIGDIITAYAVKNGMNVSDNSNALNVTAE